MNNIKNGLLSVLVLLMVLGMACSNQEKKFQVAALDYNSFKVTQKTYENMNQVGQITRVVKLETTQDSLIGSVDKIIIDYTNGDLLVGDYRNARSVFRFTSQGKFIRKYGRIGAGPAEYLRIQDFGVTANGDVIVLDNKKLIKYNKTGDLLKEIRIDYSAKYIEVIDDMIYINVLRYQKAPKEKKAIVILDPFFVEQGGIGQYDSRLEKNLHLVWHAMAKRDQQLYFIDYYDLNLNIYDTQARTLTKLSIPNSNYKLNELWEKKRLSLSDCDQLAISIHRFDDIFSFDNQLFLYELCVNKEIFRLWRVNLDKKEILIFNSESFFGVSSKGEKNGLFFNRISGSYPKGVIGAFTDAEKFNKYKANYPILKDVAFQLDDNPILAFYQFY